MRKKLIAITVCLLLLCSFAFVACGDDSSDNGGGGGTTHTHTPCPTCGLCTDSACTGASSERCQGHGSGGEGGGEEDLTPVTKLADFDIFQYSGKYSVYNYRGKDKVIKLPEHDANGNPITDIYTDFSADYFSFDNSNVEVIHIPACYTSMRGVDVNSDDPDTQNPFANARKLKAIIVDENNPSFCSVDGVLYNKSKTKMIACPYNKTDALVLPETVKLVHFTAMNCWVEEGEEGENALNSDYTNYGAFSSNISSIKLSAAIENFSLEGCRNLKSVDFGNSQLVTLPQGAFIACLKLSTLTLPDSILYIGSSTFRNSGIENLTIKDHVRAVNYFGSDSNMSLAVDLFTGCKKLKSITAPAQLLFGERDSSDIANNEYSQNNKYGKKNHFIDCDALETIIVNGSKPGNGGSAWSIAEYNYYPFIQEAGAAHARTFTALKNIKYTNNSYYSESTNTFAMSQFVTDYPNVTITIES